MATDVIYSTSDGIVQGQSTTYATACTTGSVADSTGTDMKVGQTFTTTYSCSEAFVEFNTTAIPATDNVTETHLIFTQSSDVTTTSDFNMKFVLRDYGTSITTADFVSGASLTGLGTPFATWSTASAPIQNTDLGAGLLNALVRGGYTRMLIYSDRHAAGATPTGSEAYYLRSSEYTGTTADPRLTVVHAPASGTASISAHTALTLGTESFEAAQLRLRVKDGGTWADQLAYVSAGTLNATTTGYKGTGNLEFELRGDFATWPIGLEDEVILDNGAIRYYGGFCKSIVPTITPQGYWFLGVTCKDYNTIAESKYVSDDGSAHFDFDNTFVDDTSIIHSIFMGSAIETLTPYVVTVLDATAMPEIDLGGMTRAEAMDELCKVTGGHWYVDFRKQLHYFLNETGTAPFAPSDDPDNVTSLGYRSLDITQDSIDMRNYVYVIGSGIATQGYNSAASYAVYGVYRFGVLKDDKITTVEQQYIAANAYLAAHAWAIQTASIITDAEGLEVGQNVTLYCAPYNGASAITDDQGNDEWQVQEVNVVWPDNHNPLFRIKAGNVPPPSLAAEVARAASYGARFI